MRNLVSRVLCSELRDCGHAVNSNAVLAYVLKILVLFGTSDTVVRC